MSWKKNVFSCLVWAIYLLIIGTAMIFTARVIGDSFGMAERFEVIIPAVYLLAIGSFVFLLHRMAVKLNVSPRRTGKGLLWMEGILVLALFGAGMFLRVAGLPPVLQELPEDSVYLKLAYISAGGQNIPQFSHGAVYLYIHVLRLCFLLLGNKAAAAVWLQIILQMWGALALYFAVRKMAGRIPAMFMFSFFMLSPYMMGKALELSPEMLYLFGFSLVLLFISRGVGQAPGRGFWLAAGVMAAALGYLDVAGFLLLPLMLGIIVMQGQGGGRKIVRGTVGVLAGFGLGAAVCVFADVVYSGKPAQGIARAWAELYRWGDLQLSVRISDFSTVWMITLLLCFMAWGIFSFWCHRGTERFTVWIFCLCIPALLQCLGMFTEEMDGFCYIFFFSTVLAGLGIRESMAVYPAGNADGENMQMTREENEVVEEKEAVTRERGSLEDKDGTEKGKDGTEGKRKIEFIENPLPLPKKHEKRVMDYKLDSGRDLGGYDVYVADDDDFDH